MWSCSEIRRAARERIRPSLWPVVLVTFVFIAMVSAVPVITSTINLIPTILARTNSGATRDMYSFMMLFSLISIPLSMIGIALLFFFYNPLTVGYVHFLDSLRKGPVDTGSGIKALFWPFRQGRYSRIMGATAWKYLWIMIWSYVVNLILLIPVVIVSFFFIMWIMYDFENNSMDELSKGGWMLFDGKFLALIVIFGIFLIFMIIATSVIMLNRKYAYMFTEFIVSDEPGIKAQDALNKSKYMTKDIKGRMFLLDLSFIGWHIASLFTIGLLNFWLHPYLTTAFHEVYLLRKAELRPVFADPPSVSIGSDLSKDAGMERLNEQQ